jgi:hypothetical protein
MFALDKDLQKSKSHIDEFGEIALRVLGYLPNVLSGFEDKGEYRIYYSDIAGTKKFIRPINMRLFYADQESFKAAFDSLKHVFFRMRNKESNYTDSDSVLIDSTLYTIQQSIGAGLDLLVNPNSARKHIGNRFEELIKAIFTEIGVSNKKMVLQIPYETIDGSKIYKCENDLIISPYNKVKSTSSSLNQNEIVISAKTTSKDRMGKIFIDKILLERFVGHPQKVIGIFLNDVQRKEENNYSFTLVLGLFMVYTKFLTKLEGIYYLDIPPSANKPPLSEYMRSFSQLLIYDLDGLLTP